MSKAGTLVIATHNESKFKEMRKVVEELCNWKVLSLNDFPEVPEPLETGFTYADNAMIKALSAAYRIPHWCLADDTGLEIDALKGQPGLYSKRYRPDLPTFQEKMAAILEEMKDLPDGKRKARFRSVVAMARVGAEPIVAAGICAGMIGREIKGDGGFGYDPIFIPQGETRTFGEMGSDEKNKISHRRIALTKLCEQFTANLQS
ncbi:MAG: RdgB/HAM1 family non-canonical purine NTP pyrophosphatase [Fimbriimonadaceae bacterium]